MSALLMALQSVFTESGGWVHIMSLTQTQTTPRPHTDHKQTAPRPHPGHNQAAHRPHADHTQTMSRPSVVTGYPRIEIP